MLAREAPPTACGGGNQSRHILLVVHGYPPDQTTGAEVQARRKARWWHAHGHRVTVLAADPQPASRVPFGRLEERQEMLEGIAVRRVRFAVPDATRPLREDYAHPLLAGVVEREIARGRPDLLYQVGGYLFGTLPLRVAARRAIPAALFAMDYWHVCQRLTLLRPDGGCCPGPVAPADCAACRLADRAIAQRLGPVVNRAGRRALAVMGRALPQGGLAAPLGVAGFAERQAAITQALSGVALVVANSRFLGEQLVRLGVRRERLLVVRQGIDGSEFAGQASGPAPDAAGLLVRYLGQISWHKGADLAVTAVARLRAAGLPVRLRLHGPVSGSAAYLAQLRAQLARGDGPGEGMRLEAPLDRAGLVAALRATDVLVVPSRWFENSPNVILEAFAAGVPVIAADHGGMAEMVRDGIDGLLFRPGDAASLADAIGRLARDPALLARLRAGVRRPYGLDEEMAAEEAALARLIGATGPRAYS